MRYIRTPRRNNGGLRVARWQRGMPPHLPSMLTRQSNRNFKYLVPGFDSTLTSLRVGLTTFVSSGKTTISSYTAVPSMAAKKLKNSYVTLIGDREAALAPSSVFLDRLSKLPKGQDEVDIILNGSHKHLFNSRLTDGIVKILCDAIIDSGVAIGVLDLGTNGLGDTAAAELAKLFETGATPVREIHLQGNAFGPSACKVLCEAFGNPQGAKPEVLNLNGNPIGEDGGVAVSRILGEGCNLRTLNLGNTEMGTRAIIAVAKMMWYNNSIHVLNLENPRMFDLQESTTFHIAKMIRTNGTLQQLYLGKHKMRDDGAASIAQYMEDNTNIKILDLRANEISIAGAEALAILLMKGACGLSALNLAGNKIQDQGAHAIGVALRTCRTLVDLDVRNNSIGNSGLLAIADAMNQNTAIQRLQVFGNKFEEAAADAFSELVTNRFSYFQVECDVRPYIVDGVPMVAKENLPEDMVKVVY